MRANHAATRLAERNDRPGARARVDAADSGVAHRGGFYPSIATHDDALQRYAAERAAANGWPDDAWEIEMLLGVRDDLAAALAASGRRVRL